MFGYLLALSVAGFVAACVLGLYLLSGGTDLIHALVLGFAVWIAIIVAGMFPAFRRNKWN